MQKVPFYRSLVFKLLMVVTVVALLCFVISMLLQIHFMYELKSELLARSQEMNRGFVLRHSKSWVFNTKLHIERNLLQPNLGVVPDRMASLIDNSADIVLIQVVDSTGRAVVDLNKAERGQAESGDDTGEVILMEEPLLLDGQPWGVFRVGFSMRYLSEWNLLLSRNLNQLFPRSVRHVLLLMVVPWVMGLILMLYTAFRLVLPIRQLTKATSLVALGQYTGVADIDLRRSDEIDVLRASFNDMARKLGKNYDVQHQLVLKAQQSESFLNAILDQIPEMIFMKEEDQLRFVYMNAAGEKLLGRSVTELIGKSDFDFFPKEQADAFVSKDRECLQSRKVVDVFSESIRAGDGTIHFLETKKIPLWYEPEQKTYLLGLSRDITDFKMVRDDQRHFFTNAPDMLSICGFDGYFKIVNPAFRERMGYTEDELLSRPIREFICHDDRAEFDLLMSRMITESTKSSIYMRVRHHDGRLRHVSCTATSDIASEKIYAITRDITEQLELEKQLVESATREQERLAHDLHDGLGQTLTGLALKAKLLEMAALKGTPVSTDHMRHIVSLANEASEQARTIARGMDPVVLQDGLVYALRDLSEVVSETAAVKCAFFHQPTAVIADKHTCAQLYRITQEAVNNAVRHARPGNILIRLFRQDHSVLLEVTDDGCGFSPDSALSSGSGIRNMQYRCRMIGARLDITSNPSGGTSVVVTIRTNGNGVDDEVCAVVADAVESGNG